MSVSERICNSEYYLRFDEDTAYTMNLSKWFYDPDGDVLEFGMPWHDYIRFSVDNNQLQIVPEKGWYGYTEAIFTAEDSQGGFVNQDSLCACLNTKEFHYSDFVLDFHNQISIGVAALFLILLIFTIVLSMRSK